MKAVKVDNQYLALIKKFPLAPLKNKQQFDAAIVLMKELTVPAKLIALSDSENDYLDVLSGLIMQYENKHLQPLGKPMTPTQALEYLLKESGTTQSALAAQAGVRQSHISEFLSGIRQLSKDSIVKISNFFRVSPVLFLPRETNFSYSGQEIYSGVLAIREGKNVRTKRRKR